MKLKPAVKTLKILLYVQVYVGCQIVLGCVYEGVWLIDWLIVGCLMSSDKYFMHVQNSRCFKIQCQKHYIWKCFLRDKVLEQKYMKILQRQIVGISRNVSRDSVRTQN